MTASIAVEGGLGGGRVADVALGQLEEAIGAAGQEPVAAELEGVEDPNAVPLLEEHGDQGRSDITGSAGDENSHRGLHPWWLETRLERRGCLIEDRRAARRDGVLNTPGPRPCGLLRCGARADRRKSLASDDRSRTSSEVVLSGRHYRPVKQPVNAILAWFRKPS